MQRKPSDDEISEGIRRDLEGPDARKTAGRLGCFGLFLVLVTALLAMVGPYATWMWFVHDVRYPSVFGVSYGARATLLGTSFFATWAFFHWTLTAAFRRGEVFLAEPDTVGQLLASNAIAWFQRSGTSLARFGSPLLALFFALGFANNWNALLLFRSAESFGRKDLLFGLDFGFYVFQLPLLTATAGYVFGVFFMGTLLTFAVYAGLQSLASIAKIEFTRPQIRSHTGWLFGALLLAVAANVWLKTYEAGLAPGAQFTGAGYTGVLKANMERVFAVLCALMAPLAVLNGRMWRPNMVAARGGLALVGVYFLIVLILPTLVQSTFVGPRLVEVESPFAERAIQTTRFAFGLDKAEVRDFNVSTRPKAAEIAQAASTFENMRLWDPDILRQSFSSLQSFRRYYTFDDVDIDRYNINGKQTMVMLAPREIDLDGLEATSQNWNNRRLQFTHGFGVVMAQVNGSTETGQPKFLARDIPLQTSGGIKIDQPRVYFGDLRFNDGTPRDEYAIVNTNQEELSYQTAQGSVRHRWTGNRGVPISGFLTRFAFSMVLGDGNLLVAGNLNPNSRLLMRRNVVQRASNVLPFLRFDNDPYIVVNRGRLLWMLDGYTTTDMIPYSAMVGSPGAGRMNYIRNSVKATVDAYTGEVLAYAVEPNEPLLRAYRRIYRGVVKDRSELPEGLEAHFRYPEDMLTVQSRVMATYHVTKPDAFLSGTDAWSVASERGITGVKELMRPYYVQMRLPDEPQSGFLQIIPFTPRARPNMSGWMAAHCDPGHYGRLTLYRFFTRGSLPPGPELAESNFNGNPQISEINRTFNNDQSEVIVGNLLVVPIGESVMYVEPLFLQSKTAGLQAEPRLFRVILAYEDKIVVRETYAEALAALLGSAAPAQPDPGSPRQPGEPAPVRSDGAPATPKRALELFEQADQALRSGDFAKYGELQKQLGAELERLVRSRNP
jgi:uncharacterized membrane protein (UPF0182 family)